MKHFVAKLVKSFGHLGDTAESLDPVVDPNDTVIEFENASGPKTDATAGNVPATGQRKQVTTQRRKIEAEFAVERKKMGPSNCAL